MYVPHLYRCGLVLSCLVLDVGELYVLGIHLAFQTMNMFLQGVTLYVQIISFNLCLHNKQTLQNIIIHSIDNSYFCYNIATKEIFITYISQQVF